MSFIPKTLTSLILVAAVPIFSAEAPVPSPKAQVAVAPAAAVTSTSDMLNAYTQVAAAAAKAEAVLTTLATLVDSRKNGVEENRRMIDSARQKAVDLYEKARRAEEGKVIDKSPTASLSLEEAKNRIEAQAKETNDERSSLDTSLRLAEEQSNALRNAFNRCEELSKATKDARLDVAPLQQVYSQLENKGQALTASASKSISAYGVIKDAWTKSLEEATKSAH